MTFEKAIELLHEFYYEKNGKAATIYFLEYIIAALKENNNE